jgi:RHS repeat-associated protein
MLRTFAPFVLTLAIGASLLIAPPAAIADAGDGSSPSEEASAIGLGGFAVGDGVEALIGESDGSLSFTVPLGPVSLVWDSRFPAEDRYGLGERWRLDTAFVDRRGGVRVAPTSGGVFDANAAEPSGLSGYATADVRFQPAEPDALTGRDGVDRADAAWSLFELGGTVTHFADSGEPVAQVTATGRRVDWLWHPDRPHRLTRVVNAEGIVTELAWRRGSVTVSVGTNLASPVVWRVELDARGPVRIVDPVGGVSEIGYDGGLVSSIAGPSGATANVTWHASSDAVARVARVAVLGADGTERSARTWQPVGATVPSGWPLLGDGTRGPGRLGGPSRTELSDGALRVRATHDGLGRIVDRTIAVATASGERTIQQQAFEYRHPAERVPSTGAGSAAWSKPVRTTLTHIDAAGRTRTIAESFEFDDLGRLVRHVAGDGTESRTEYDTVPAGAPDAWRPPVGMPVRQTTVAPDGSTVETVHELDASRTAVIASRSSQGTAGAMVVTGAEGFEVEPDGFVSKAWSHPGGDSAAVPLVTDRRRSVDAAAGTVTVTETVSAGELTLPPTSSTTSLVHGGALEAVDGSGRRATATYDAIGRLVEQVDASGRRVQVAHQSAREHGRNATIVTLPDGIVETEVRDELGRVVELTDNIKAGVATPGHVRVAERREYPAPGTVRVIDAWGQVTTTMHDLFGRASWTELPNGLVAVTEHDDVAGTTRSGLTPTGRLSDAPQVAVQRRDESGRVVEATAERADRVGSPTVKTAFDGFGRPTSSSDGRRTAEVAFDAGGRPETTSMREIDGPLTMTERRRFDAFGSSLGKQRQGGEHEPETPGGSRTTDALGRVTSETDRFGVTTSVEYDSDGQVARTIDTNGLETRVDYEHATGLPVRSTTTAPGRRPVATEIDYDRVTGLPVRVRDANAPNDELSYTYDAFGNVLDTRYPDGTTISRRYDDHGRPVALIDAAGLITVYEYDEHGTLSAAVQHRDGVDGPVVASARYRYDRHGRVDRIDRGNGVATEYTFTSVGQVASETTTSGVETTATREYDYDAYGALVRRTDRTSDEAGGALCTQTTDYRYDAFHRLRGSTVTTEPCADAGPVEATVRTTDYDVTAAGDVARRTVDAHGRGDAERSSRTFEYSAAGELLAIDDDGDRRTQVFDDTGHLIRGADGTRYDYDAGGRVIAQTDADEATTTTTYWPDGSRRELATGDARTTFYWDTGELVNDRHLAGGGHAHEATASYLLGASRHARVLTTGDKPAEVGYYGTDRHGNVTDMTDEHGDTIATYRYGDYGEPLTDDRVSAAVGDATRNPYRYAGEYTDPEGAQPLGERVYDPELARFRTPDPAPQFNRFAFADLNPIMNVDPTGRTARTDAGHWVTLGIGVAVAVAAAVVEIVTAGTTAAMVAAVVAGAIDAGLQLLDGINQKVEFMPGQLGVVIGVAAVAATIGLGMYMKRTTLLPKSKGKASTEVVHGAVPAGDAPGADPGVLVPSPNVKGGGDAGAGYVVLANQRESELVLVARLPYDERFARAPAAFARRWDSIERNGKSIAASLQSMNDRGVFSGEFDRGIAFLWNTYNDALIYRRFLLSQSRGVSRLGLWGELAKRMKNDQGLSARIALITYGPGWRRWDQLTLYEPIAVELVVMHNTLLKYHNGLEAGLTRNAAAMSVVDCATKLRGFSGVGALVAQDAGFLPYMPAGFSVLSTPGAPSTLKGISGLW